MSTVFSNLEHFLGWKHYIVSALICILIISCCCGLLSEEVSATSEFSSSEQSAIGMFIQQRLSQRRNAQIQSDDSGVSSDLSNIPSSYNAADAGQYGPIIATENGYIHPEEFYKNGVNEKNYLVKKPSETRVENGILDKQSSSANDDISAIFNDENADIYLTAVPLLFLIIVIFVYHFVIHKFGEANVQGRIKKRFVIQLGSWGKKTLSCFLICLLLMTSFTGIIFFTKADPTTIYVDDDNTDGPWDGSFENPYRYIQDAIDNATVGDIIQIHSGDYIDTQTYNMNTCVAVVNKSLILIGENKYSSIINASFLNFGLVINASNVQIYNLSLVRGLASGIYIGDDTSFSTIENCIFTDNGLYGISGQQSSGNTINRNIISNSSINGILLWPFCNETLISNNTIMNNSVGIYFQACSNNIIINNTIAQHNSYGIAIYYSQNNTFQQNSIWSNNGGIDLYDTCFNNTFTNNDIFNNNICGIKIRACNNNLIYNNNFTNVNNAWDNGSNVWNISKTAGVNIYGGSFLGGNYWNDYEGIDNNGDGLGDTQIPYTCYGDVVSGGDYLPLTTPSPQNMTISGRVLDANTSIPLEGATVMIFTEAFPGLENNMWQTNASGGFSADITSVNGSPGSYTVEIMMDGYVGFRNESIILSEGQQLDLGDISLEPIFDEANYSFIRGIVGDGSVPIENAEVMLLDTDFSHMSEEMDKSTTTDETGAFNFNITYRSTYVVIAFFEGFYAAFSDPSIIVSEPQQTHWSNFTLSVAEPDILNITITFTDLDDITVSVNRTVIAASPMVRFSLDIMPGLGDSNQIVSIDEVTSYLEMLTEDGTVFKSFSGGGEQDEGKGAPDFLSSPISMLLDDSTLDSYVAGSHSGTLENIVNTTVNSNATVYYNATFSATLDGLVLNQVDHSLNITTVFNSSMNSNVVINFDSFYYMAEITQNDTNASVINTTSTVFFSPGAGGVESLAYLNITLLFNGSTVSLPIIEVPTWHINDYWTYNNTEYGALTDTMVTVDDKPLRQHDQNNYRIGDMNASYVSYVLSENSVPLGGFKTQYVSMGDLDWINCSDQQHINFLWNDVDFPMYSGKTWLTRTWWGEQVNATIIDCSASKLTSNGTFSSCVRINYTNSTDAVLVQEWYSPAIHQYVNRTRYFNDDIVSYRDLSGYSLAPFINATSLIEYESDDEDILIDSLNVLVTIDASQLSSPGDYILEGSLYVESHGFGQPTEITWVSEELSDLIGIQIVNITYSGSLISGKQVDGPYTGWLELKEFQDWGPGRTLDYTSFTTDAYDYTQFELPVVSFTNISDYGNDTDSDGSYNYLTVNIALDVLEDGNYSIHSGLNYIVSHGFWDDCFWITGTGIDQQFMAAGTTPTVCLNFDGTDIYAAGYNGYYQINLELIDEDTGIKISENQSTCGTYYNYSQFETPSVFFNKTYMAQNGQHEYINSGTYLTINASVFVADGAFGNGTETYDLHGGIHYIDGGTFGDYITGNGGEISLHEGENIVPVNFNLADIIERNATYNGSFGVCLGLCERIGDWFGPEVDNIDYVTQNYDVQTDFPDPPISMLIVNDSIVDGGDYLRVGVSIMVNSVEYVGQQFDLHGGVHYVQGQDWYYITGYGDWVTLSLGYNNLSLDFSGMEIAASGHNGPYRIWVGLDTLPEHQMLVNKEYTTFSYLIENFSQPSVQFGTMIDGQNDSINGSDYLTVDVPIIVNTPGTYHVGGGIHWVRQRSGWDEWMFITGVGGEYNLSDNTTIAFNFDQGMIRDALQTYNYSGSLKVFISVESMDPWTQIAHLDYSTRRYSYLNFSASAVTITDDSVGITDAGDLFVNLSLSVITAGQYTVNGGIHWVDQDNWWYFITGIWSQPSLTNESTYLNLTFNGGEIYNSLQNGPYKIWIGIQNKTTYRQITIREITVNYNYTDFADAAPDVRIVRENMSAGAADYMNGSYLTVNVTLESSSSGTYWLDGNLNSEDWQWITNTGSEITVTTGTQIIPLNFRAGDISLSGLDGPYRVWIGLRDTQTWSDVDHYEYSTQAYSAADAPEPPFQFENMTDGLCDYLNGSYITINATISISSDAYAGIYDLHGGVHYNDSNGWWQHITGTGTLTNQTLTFDGSKSNDPDGTITNYTWDFGDGTFGYGIHPTHSYEEYGTFIVVLTIIDNSSMTDNDTTAVSVYLDTDGDGWSDQDEELYGTDPKNPDAAPQDTDDDRIPDIADTDDDNDGLSDEVEQKLGSDPENDQDVIQITFMGKTYYLVDTNGDGQIDFFYDLATDTKTMVVFIDGMYLIDTNNDGVWDYIYDPVAGTLTAYKPEQKPTGGIPWTFIIITVIIVIVIILFIVVVLFKTGRLYFDKTPKKKDKPKKP